MAAVRAAPVVLTNPIGGGETGGGGGGGGAIAAVLLPAFATDSSPTEPAAGAPVVFAAVVSLE